MNARAVSPEGPCHWTPARYKSDEDKIHVFMSLPHWRTQEAVLHFGFVVQQLQTARQPSPARRLSTMSNAGVNDVSPNPGFLPA